MPRTNQIFISYRRDDSAAVAGRIYDRLVYRYGRKGVFKDVDSIPLGVNFKEYIDSVIKDCDLVIVVIGDRWLATVGGAYKRRIDDPRDLVRIEIESALERHVPVIPVLVQNASMSSEPELPPSLRELGYRNGMAIRHDPDFHPDMDRLIKSMDALVSQRPANPEIKIPAMAAQAKQVVSAKLQESKRILGDRLIGSGERGRFVLFYLSAVILMGLLLSFPTPRSFYSDPTWTFDDQTIYFLAKAVVFITIQAAAQALLIRKYLPGAVWWILVTLVGIVFGALACLPLLPRNARPADVYSLSLTIPYIFAGVTLWLRLRKQVHFAWLWPVANCSPFVSLQWRSAVQLQPEPMRTLLLWLPAVRYC